MLLSHTFSGAASVDYHEAGDFFRLMSASAAVDVRYYRQGKEIAEAEGVGGGYAEKFAEHFDRVSITSASAQTIVFVTRLGNLVFYDTPPNGNVTVTNINGAFTQSTKTVTNASASMVAANAARRYLLIQNKSATGDIYLNLAGAAATVAGGVKIAAGASYELQGYACTGAIFAIGSIASNAEVIAVEG